jgi:DNA-binding transcriptional regulator GbsR (MarR family)
MPSKSAHKIDAASQEFIEAMGLVYQGDGLPRIAGRILGFLTIKDEAFSLQELADCLQVSRGSISTNTRLLEQFGMVERLAKPGDRQGFYHLAPSPYSRGLRGAIRRLTKAHRTVRTARAKIPKSAKGAHKNLAEMDRFYDVAINGLEDILSGLASDPQ